MLFDAMMVSMGYAVLRPASMSSVYDRVVEINGRFVRFQIKSVNRDVSAETWIKVKTTGNRNIKYKISDVDYFAIYISSKGSWYFHQNAGKGIVFVSFRNLDNFVECLGIKS